MPDTSEPVPVTDVDYVKAEETFLAAAADGIDCFSVPRDEASLCAAVREHDARAVIVGVESYRDELYNVLPRGGIIARFGVGFDGVDLDRAARAGILVTNTPGALSDTVAEYAVWLMGALARHIPRAHADMRNNRWHARVGVELKGATLALLGCGAIGRRVARIAAVGLRMNVVGYDIVDIPEEARQDMGLSSFTQDLPAALADADFVSLHMPSSPKTRHFISADTLALIPPRACLINTARGPVVDEIALYDALASGKLAGAALDVFETEPYVPRDPAKDLRTLENTVLTCHMASASTQACTRMASQALANVRAALDNRLDDCDIVNPDVREVLEA